MYSLVLTDLKNITSKMFCNLARITQPIASRIELLIHCVSESLLLTTHYFAALPWRVGDQPGWTMVRRRIYKGLRASGKMHAVQVRKQDRWLAWGGPQSFPNGRSRASGGKMQAFPSPSTFCPCFIIHILSSLQNSCLPQGFPQVDFSWEPRTPYILTRNMWLKESPSHAECTRMTKCPRDPAPHVQPGWSF